MRPLLWKEFHDLRPWLLAGVVVTVSLELLLATRVFNPSFVSTWMEAHMPFVAAIVAIGLTAALRATGVGTDAVGEYRDHLLALWLAQNIVAERTARRDWPAPDSNSSDEVYAKRHFLVRQEVKSTPNPRFRRLNVLVSSQEEPGRTLQSSVTFLTLPQ